MVAALALGTGRGDRSPPSSSVSAIVPHLALLPPSLAKSNSSLISPSSPILGLELLLCTAPSRARSGLIMAVISERIISVSWLGWLLIKQARQFNKTKLCSYLRRPFWTLAIQLVTPLGLLTITSHHPEHQHPHPPAVAGISGSWPLFLPPPSFLISSFN